MFGAKKLRKDQQNNQEVARMAMRGADGCGGLSLLTFSVLSLCMAGCAANNVPAAKPTTGRLPTIAEVPGADETVRGEDDQPIVYLALGSALREHKLSRSEELPANIVVPTTNLNGVPVTAALEAVLAGTDVSLSWDSKTWANHLVTVTNLSGPLPRVVEKICGSARVFCSYRHGLLEMKEKETFIIEVPALPTKGGSSSSAAANTMAEAISDLAGDKAKIDQQGGNLIYTTDVEGQDMVREYLEQLRNGRPLVVMQFHVWEVTLSRENGAGINWTSFKIPKLGGGFEALALSGSTAFSSLTSPGVSLGATTTGKVSSSSVLEFLSTQGSVQNISSPQLTFVSGSEAEFRVGGKQRYVSQVGLSSSVSGTSSSSTTSSTVSTDSVDTGLTVTVNGAYEGGVITANMELTIQNLVRIDSVATSDTKIQLPVTTDRKMSTMVRVRPGDNLLLAGMISSKDSNTNEAIPLPFGMRAQTYGDDTLENSELVILVKPSVVLFTDKDPSGTDKAKLPQNASLKPLPEAVTKDGQRSVFLPDNKKTLPQPDLKPELGSLSAQPVAASPISVPVSQAVMPQALPPQELPVQAVPVQAVPAAAPQSLANAQVSVAAPVPVAVQVSPLSGAPSPAAVLQEPTPLASAAVAPQANTSSSQVDRGLLQSGFSHAYDQMLTATSAGSNQGGRL